MSKTPRPQASVFGALGPDDAYFSNRVQVAARDAQQRWPLLGGLQPAAASEPPPLSADDKARWQPHLPLAPQAGKSGPARPSLGKKLESGLGRLVRQTAVDNQLASPRRRDEFTAIDDRLNTGGADPSRFAATEPAPLLAPTPAEPAVQRPAVRAGSRAQKPVPPPPAAAPLAPTGSAKRPAAAATPSRAAAAPTAPDPSLSSVFQRLNQALGDPTPAPRKSMLGRLAKR